MRIRISVLVFGALILALLGGVSASAATPPSQEEILGPARLYLPLVNRFYDPLLYDNFNDPAYEGAWNPALWTWAAWNEPWVHMEQRNGALVLWNTTPSGAGGGQLLTKAVSPRVPGQSWMVEARLKMSSDRTGGYSSVQLKAHTEIAARGWTANCTLGGSANSAWARLSCGLARDQYVTADLQVPYDKWHTVRIEIAPDTAELRFYVNGNLLGSHMPTDAVLLKDITQMEPNIQLWNGAADATSTRFVDDVRVQPR